MADIYGLYNLIEDYEIDYVKTLEKYNYVLQECINPDITYYTIWDLFPWLIKKYDNYINNIDFYFICLDYITENCDDYIDYDNENNDELFAFTMFNLIQIYQKIYKSILSQYPNLKKELSTEINRFYKLNNILLEEINNDINIHKIKNLLL